MTLLSESNPVRMFRLYCFHGPFARVQVVLRFKNSTCLERLLYNSMACRSSLVLTLTSAGEELFTANAPHIRQGLAGAEIFTNSSGSHHQLRKLQLRIELIREGTRKSGGVYLYGTYIPGGSI